MVLTTIYLVAAVIGGTILVCQFVLSLIGLGHGGADIGHDVGGDFHGDAHVGGLEGHHAGADSHPDSTHMFAVVSFRTVVAALAFFGVTGLATTSGGLPATTTLVLAMLAGAGAMYGMYGLLRLIANLGSAGNEQIGNAIGLIATVYVPIPAAGKGAGKVQLSMQSRIVEYQAMTQGSEKLKTGEKVEVVGIANSDTVEVRRAAPVGEIQPAAIS
jgi:hypothetical protein